MAGCKDITDQPFKNSIVGTYFAIKDLEVYHDTFLKFKSDGKFSSYHQGELRISGTYEINNETINLKASEYDEIIKLKIEGNIIILDKDDGVRFIRKGFEDIVPDLVKQLDGIKAFSSKGIDEFVEINVWGVTISRVETEEITEMGTKLLVIYATLTNKHDDIIILHGF